jgi:Mg-chelatase subunit ChlD
MEAFETRIKRLVRPISAHWGVHYPISVETHESALAYINYKLICLNPLYSYLSDTQLSTLLKHEFGHRIFAPGSPTIGKEHRERLASVLNTDDEETIANLLNIAYDLIVDKGNTRINQDNWGFNYRQGMLEIERISFEASKSSESHNSHLTVAAQGVRLNRLIRALYIFNLGGEWLFPELTYLEDTVTPLLQQLFGENSEENERIINFCQSLYEHFPTKFRIYLPAPFARLVRAIRAKQNGNSDPSNHGISFTIASNSAGSESGKGNNNEKQFFNLAVTEQVTQQLLSTRQATRRYSGFWSLSHPHRTLDIKRSQRHSQYLIPGITTRRLQNSDRVIKKLGTGHLNLCLVVDDSGSMDGKRAIYARSISEGINRFAAIAGYPIALITFGSSLGETLPLSNRHSLVTRALKKLDGELGGTDIDKALCKLLEWLKRRSSITRVVLVSDSEFSDWHEAGNRIRQVLEYCHITLLLINQEVPKDMQGFAFDSPGNFRAFKVDPEKTTEKAILEEISQ